MAVYGEFDGGLSGLRLRGGELCRELRGVGFLPVRDDAEGAADVLGELAAGLVGGLLLGGDALLSSLGTRGGEVGFEAGDGRRAVLTLSGCGSAATAAACTIA
ncbi:hypothetical protein A8W25_28105 [Streptomyces sp. ERV7]|uniref:hypothetical protein n=1 Tax=Streptomyces sp. ERV7 TaxID=1322334 RepID=UPI0007F32EF1|nr:hypothetical protein [Streptomyces sp. ERV7]OAR21910.1 hypothetical protein A8W25_28105 [Streptomyces sp. ERV7]